MMHCVHHWLIDEHESAQSLASQIAQKIKDESKKKPVAELGLSIVGELARTETPQKKKTAHDEGTHVYCMCTASKGL